MKHKLSHQRKWWGKWHLWLGLLAGTIVSVVGITGSILVFQTEIDRALNPALYYSEKTDKYLDFEDVYSILRQDSVDLAGKYLIALDGEGANYKLMYGGASGETYINAYTGKIIATRQPTESFTGAVLELHRSLMIPYVGKYIVGAAALGMLILVVTGIRMWTPRSRKNLRKSLTVKFGAGAVRRTLDLHKVTGVFLSPALTMLSLSGCCLTLNIVILTLLFAVNGKSPNQIQQIFGAQSDSTFCEAPKPAAGIFAAFHASYPTATIKSVSFPATPVGVYIFNAVNGKRPAGGKQMLCIVDNYSGKMLFDSERDLSNATMAYLSWLQPFHFGSFGGILTRCIACLAGLLPLFLTITGFLIWRSRYRKFQLKSASADVPKTKPAVGIWRYFGLNLLKGFSYGLRCLIASVVIGLVYGAFGLAVIEAVAFIIIFTFMLSVVNLLVALIVFILQLPFVPFRKGSYAIHRYFAWSLTFTLVFAVGYFIITQFNIF
ncbi:MAG: PepSY domain-containing protein [Dysgonamonadaceae bacterium]|nr:PepSY domain-containing protein [Dysgonamonadaceae bacterium]